MSELEAVIAKIEALKTSGERQIVAMAEPPAAGKSTVTERLQLEFGTDLAVLPMDGFHLDNVILDAKNLRARKGAPETFDVQGFVEAVRRVKAGAHFYAPAFDRVLDLSRAGAIEITDEPIVLVEGNYLLLKQAPWNALAAFWDLSIWLDVSLETVEKRCIQRWLDHDHSLADATRRARENDVRNAAFVIDNSGQADFVLRVGEV